MNDTLLDQADALMRRRRPPPAPAASADVADSLEISDIPTLSPVEDLAPPPPQEEISGTAKAELSVVTNDDLDDFPLLTEIISATDNTRDEGDGETTGDALAPGKKITASAPPPALLGNELERWLDEHLPGIIAQVVAENIPKLSTQVIERLRLHPDLAHPSEPGNNGTNPPDHG